MISIVRVQSMMHSLASGVSGLLNMLLAALTMLLINQEGPLLPPTAMMRSSPDSSPGFRILQATAPLIRAYLHKSLPVQAWPSQIEDMAMVKPQRSWQSFLSPPSRPTPSQQRRIWMSLGRTKGTYHVRSFGRRLSNPKAVN